MTTVLEDVATAVAALTEALPGLLEQCTDPEARDMAELLFTIREAHTELGKVVRDTETATATAMLASEVQAGDLYAERYRSADRKAWLHDDWQHDVRTKVLQARGLKGAQGVLTADGEVLPADVLSRILADVQAAHGAQAPKATTLRALGLDPDDYCERSPGAWHVKVTKRVAAEGGQTDAA